MIITKLDKFKKPYMYFDEISHYGDYMPNIRSHYNTSDFLISNVEFNKFRARMIIDYELHRQNISIIPELSDEFSRIIDEHFNNPETEHLFESHEPKVTVNKKHDGTLDISIEFVKV